MVFLQNAKVEHFNQKKDLGRKKAEILRGAAIELQQSSKLCWSCANQKCQQSLENIRFMFRSVFSIIEWVCKLMFAKNLVF